MKKHSKLQLARVIIQVLAFVFYAGAWASTFNAINQVYLSLTTGSPNGGELFIYLVEAVAIIPVTIIFGRFFCGWLCAFGSLNDFIYSVSSKFYRHKMSPKLDAMLKYLKYFVFAFVALVLWNGLITTREVLSPWDSFARIFMFKTTPTALNFKLSIPSVSIGLILFAMIVVGSMFIERFFCRYLCPLGAFFSITSKLRIFKIKKPTENCGSCRSCTNNCPMGIEMFKKEKISSGECIFCMKCTSVCPKSNTKLGIYAADISPGIACGIALSAIVGVYSIDKQVGARINAEQALVTVNVQSSRETANPTANSTLNPTLNSTKKPLGDYSDDNDDNNTNYNKPTTVTTHKPVIPYRPTAKPIPTLTKYKNGTFNGTADGFNGPLSVSVTISNDRITRITIGPNGDDGEYLQRAENKVIPAIYAAQSPNVSKASGATFSSEGIKNAVSNALVYAKN